MRPFRAVLLLPLVLLSSTVSAATFVVTRFDDPLPQACTPQSCSLREAVASGNIDPFAEPDRIELAAGTYTLVRGALPIRHALVLVGAGAAATRITTDAVLFDTNVDLTLRDVSVASTDFNVLVMRDEGTLLLENVDVPADGATIHAIDAATLDIRGGVIADAVQCNAAQGACMLRDTRVFTLYVIPSATPGSTLLLERAHIDGGLFPDADLDSTVSVHRSPSVEILDSTFTGTALRIADATLQASGSTFDDSPLHVTDSTLRIEDSRMTRGSVRVENAPEFRATFRRLAYIDNSGPIRSESPSRILIEDSEFSDNSVRALYAADDSDWTIRRSSFVRNSADGNAGGAIVVEDTAYVKIENSTFSGNNFPPSQAGTGARGAAIGFRNIVGARLDLDHVTMVRAPGVPQGVLGTLLGGVAEGEMIVNIFNSLLIGNCWLQPGVLHFGGGNIESPGDTCDLDASGNQLGVAPADIDIGGLGDHGGPTPTYLPADDSIARDTAAESPCLPVDQRGFPRPAGDGCDVGAVEIGATIDLFADGFESP